MWPTHIWSFRYGRRRSTQLPVLLSLVFGVVAGLSPNLYFYLVSQFIIAATLGGYRINSIVLGMNLANLNFFYSLFTKLFIILAIFFFFLLLLTLCAATEWIGVNKRSLAACLSQEFAALGQCLTAGLIYAIRDWRTIQYVLAGMQGFVLLYIWCVIKS